MKARKPSINPNLFKGLTGEVHSPPNELEAATEKVQGATREASRRDLATAVGSSSAPEAGLRGRRRYQRLHLYASEGMLRRVRQMHAEALAANLPLGQRGPSVIMAAALDRFDQLSAEDRLEAIRKRLES